MLHWCQADQVILIVFLSGSLALCCAQWIHCNITHSTWGTLYSVPDFQATNCLYSWTNSTGHVLANKNEMVTDLVLNSSIRTLLTRTCLDQVNYTRDCTSEEIQYWASCFTDCSGTPEQKNEGPQCYHWSTVITVSIMVLMQLQFLPAAS